MRILLINKYNYLKGGAERYLFDLKQLLERNGHTVAVFAMRHARNPPSQFDHYFVPNVDFRNLSLMGRLKAALRVIWYPQAAQHLARLLDDFQPEVVHLSNIYHQLSPSILKPIRQHDIPIIHTLHDYKLVCPNYLLYTKGQPCMRCCNRQYFQAVRHRCLHNALSWSFLAAIEMTLHKHWQIYERSITNFVAPSRFLKDTVQTFGIPSEQVHHVPNFIFPERFSLSQEDGGYFVYLGRLSQEKGLPTLIEAMRQLPQARLLIIGEGLMRSRLTQMIVDRGLSNISLTGYLCGQALKETLAQARFTVVPSEYYEVFPYSVLESLALGKAVVGARIGGIPEQIEDTVDGLLFPPGDEDALANCLQRLWEKPKQTRQMGLNGRQKVLAHFTPERYYRQIMPLYRKNYFEKVSN